MSSISNNQQAEIIYKKLQGKASTNADRSVYEEYLDSNLVLSPETLWFDMDKIPDVAPTLANLAEYSVTVNESSYPILRYYENQELLRVPGSSNAFYHPNLKDAIPFNYNSDGSYSYVLSDAVGNVLVFGLNNWTVDNGAGVLTFFDGTPTAAALPLRISFYKYIGRKAYEGLVRTDGTSQMSSTYSPLVDQDVVTKHYVDTNTGAMSDLLEKLLPIPPANLSSTTLGISGSYSAFASGTGVIHPNCINTLRPSISPSSSFYNGDEGTLTAYIDLGTVGTRVLTTADDTGVYSALNITEDVDPYVGIEGKQGFYKQLTANITPTTDLSIISGHSAKLSHSITGDTPLFTFNIDDPSTTTISSVSISPPISSTRYISGVPSLSTSDHIRTTFQVNNAVRTHYGANGARITSSHVAEATLPITGTPSSGSTLSFTTDLAVLSNVYTERAAFTIEGLNSAQIAGTPSTSTTYIRIDTISNELSRVRSGKGEYPTAFGSTFDSQESIYSITLNEELQLLNGSYQWPSGNYTANLPINGPDYTSVPTPTSGDRWATFMPITLSSASGFTLTVGGAVNWLAGDDKATSGVKIFARVMTENNIPVTGWIDCNSPYPGVGIPGNTVTQHGDAAMVVGSESTTATTKRVTFGPITRSGRLFIRIGLTSSGSRRFSTVSVTAN